MRIPLARCAVLVALIVAALAGAAPAPGVAAPASPEQETLGLLNAQRAAAGLRPLRLDPTLSLAARGHAADMVANGYFAHDSPSGDGLVDRVRGAGWLTGRPRWQLGETLAWGVGPLASPAAIVDAWMNSPPHRHVILVPRFRSVGIAVVAGTPHSQIGATYVADFGVRARAARR